MEIEDIQRINSIKPQQKLRKMSTSKHSNKTSKKAVDKTSKRKKKGVIESEDENSVFSSNERDTSFAQATTEANQSEEEDEEFETEDKSVDSDKSEVDVNETEEGEVDTKLSEKFNINNHFSSEDLVKFMNNKDFKQLKAAYDETLSVVFGMELQSEDDVLTSLEIASFADSQQELKKSFKLLVSKGNQIKVAETIRQRNVGISKRSGPIVSGSTFGSTSLSGVSEPTVRLELLRDKPGMLRTLKSEHLIIFRQQVLTALNQVESLDYTVYIPPDTQNMITALLHKNKLIINKKNDEWVSWGIEVLSDRLMNLLYATEGRKDKTPIETIMDGLTNLVFHCDIHNEIPCIQILLNNAMKLFRDEQLIGDSELDTEDTIPNKKNRKLVLDVLVSNLKTKSKPVHYLEFLKDAIDDVIMGTDFQKVPSVSGLIIMIQDQLNSNKPKILYHLDKLAKLRALGYLANFPSTNNNVSKSIENKPRTPVNLNKRNHSTMSEALPQCDGCGKKHPNIDNCFFKEHPDYNRSSAPWVSSYIGRFYKTQGHEFLVKHLKRDGHNGTKLISHQMPRKDPPKDNKVFANKKHSKCYLCSLSKSTHTSSVTTSYFIIGNDRIQLKTLLDTGAESGSYMSAKVAAWLEKRGVKKVKSDKIVCSCFGDCRMLSNCINAPLNFENVNINTTCYDNKSIHLTFWVIDKLPFDIVIGDLDIQANTWLRFLNNTPSTLIDSENLKKRPNNDKPLSLIEGSSRHPTLNQSKKVPKHIDTRPMLLDNSLHENREGSVISQQGRQPKPAIPTKRIHISKILNYEPEANGIPEKWDSLDECLNADTLMVVQSEPTDDLPTHIMGSPELQSDIKDLLVEFSDIFRKDVSPKPADVPSMDVKVDKLKWNSLKGNMGVSPRVQSRDKNSEIQKQVEKMLQLGVIQRSNSNRYSQVLLVPKPNNKWRFCIDYQPLNACCEGDGWNLPNIQHMLQRLGGHRPKLFAVMDLTSGYHQAPLNLSSRMFSAFITFMGIFEWLRVPMGLKGAASYFQKVLATVVLIGLIYYTCELYIDDIVVHAQDAQSFLIRLRQVFERLRKHNITLNPEKCKFGLPSVEYVGHTIDETGLSFSTEKLNEVLAIQPPTYAKELRSFLGLASYFRDHINNLATIAKPLQDMIVDYEKKRKLVWTPEAEQAFTNVKDAIKRCPKLFFMDDNAPIYLHTDASDYGIGAYLFQIIDGIEQPIAFMSKTLSAEELKWSTIEKECYAIVFSLRKFEYLLRDKHFTLRTDHANLTYVNDPPSPKVRRWKIAIQEYDFDLEFIDGLKNVVADGFSRLLPISVEILCVLKGLKIPDDKYKLLGQVHNTTVGHHGLDRMLKKLRSQNIEWKEMRDHARKFIDNCPCCQKMNNLKVSIKTHPFHLSTLRPMEVIHMDTLYMGVTNDNNNSYLLVLIDSCSRWLELFPIPDLSAEQAAVKLFEHFGRFGMPGQILTDNGKQFINKLHDELHILTGIDKLQTTPYSHEENGIVERANKEILRHVRSILFDKGIHKEWNLAIPLVQRILNSQQSSTTGCSPAELIFTNAPNLDKGIYMPLIPSSIDKDSLSIWHSKRLTLQQRVLSSARQNKQVMEAEKLAQTSGTPTEYAEGSYVLLRYPEEDIIKGSTGKLKLPLKGPMLVTKVNGDKYSLQDITTGKHSDVHISRLYQFYYDDTKFDPAEIARKDLDEEVVEDIVDHTIHKHKSKMEFRVRWLGYDEGHDLWLPWRQLRDNPKLHKYLYVNGMQRLIPSEHRKQEYH